MERPQSQVPEASFWQDLNDKVAEIGARTRTQQRRAASSHQHFPRRWSRLHLDNQSHQQQQEEQKITNRLKYLQLEKERRNRALWLAKIKYQKVMEIRSSSFKEKQEAKQKRGEDQQRLIHHALEQVGRVRATKQKVTLSLKKIQEEHSISAREVRSSSLQIQESLRTSRQLEMTHKRELVDSMHKTMQLSRGNLSQMREERTERARVEHQHLLEHKLRANRNQHQKNSLLKQKLHQSLLVDQQERNRCIPQIKHYTTLTHHKSNSGCKFNSIVTAS